MSDPEGNSYFCFPESPDVSLDFVLGNIRTRGKTNLTGFPREYNRFNRPVKFSHRFFVLGTETPLDFGVVKQ